MIILQIIFLVLWCLGILDISIWITLIPLYLSIAFFLIYFIGYSIYKKKYTKDLYNRTFEITSTGGGSGGGRITNDSSENFELGHPGTGGFGGKDSKIIVKDIDNDRTFIFSNSNSNIGNGGKGIPGTGGLGSISCGGEGKVIDIYDNSKKIFIDDKYST